MSSFLPVSPLSSQAGGDANTELTRLPEPICPIIFSAGLPVCEDPGAARAPKNLVHRGNPCLLLVRYSYFTRLLETTAPLCPITTKNGASGVAMIPRS